MAKHANTESMYLRRRNHNASTVGVLPQFETSLVSRQSSGSSVRCSHNRKAERIECRNKAENRISGGNIIFRTWLTKGLFSAMIVRGVVKAHSYVAHGTTHSSLPR